MNIGDEVTAGDLVFNPASNYNGPSSFTFSAHDGEVWSTSTAAVSITVDPVNDAPIATSTTSSAPYGNPITVSLDGSDSDLGDAVERYRVDTAPPAGNLYLAGALITVGDEITVADVTSGDLIFLPDPTFSGLQEFEFSAFDGESWSLASATATINVVGEPTMMLKDGDEGTSANESDNEMDSSDDEVDSEADENLLEAASTPISQFYLANQSLVDDTPDLNLPTRELMLGDDSELDRLESENESTQIRRSSSADDSGERETTATLRGPGMAARELDLDVPDLNDLAESLSRRAAEEVAANESVIASVETAAFATSTALLAISSRTSSLVAMAVASLPGWRYFDPLAIVSVPQAARRARDAAMLEAAAEDDESGGRLRDLLGH